jgi:SAM-dependent methyltransferase
MSKTSFDDLADVYEAMIDWPKRLANEEPFFRWVFDRVNARSVLDVACGTGHHVARFAGWGLRIEGADLSEEMIGRCRRRWSEDDARRWSVRRLDQKIENA